VEVSPDCLYPPASAGGSVAVVTADEGAGVVSAARLRPTRRIGLLWRGDGGPAAASDRAEERLGPLLSAFRDLPVEVVHVAYTDDAVAEARATRRR
jgi:hypothetical protein